MMIMMMMMMMMMMSAKSCQPSDVSQVLSAKWSQPSNLKIWQLFGVSRWCHLLQGLVHMHENHLLLTQMRFHPAIVGQSTLICSCCHFGAFCHLKNIFGMTCVRVPHFEQLAHITWHCPSHFSDGDDDDGDGDDGNSCTIWWWWRRPSHRCLHNGRWGGWSGVLLYIEPPRALPGPPRPPPELTQTSTASEGRRSSCWAKKHSKHCKTQHLRQKHSKSTIKVDFFEIGAIAWCFLTFWYPSQLKHLVLRALLEDCLPEMLLKLGVLDERGIKK